MEEKHGVNNREKLVLLGLGLVLAGAIHNLREARKLERTKQKLKKSFDGSIEVLLWLQSEEAQSMSFVELFREVEMRTKFNRIVLNES